MNAVEEGTLEIVTQKLEELVKKKPVTPSPNINPRLVVLDIHNASSSSSRTALENEREIEQLEDQFRGLEVKRLHHPTLISLTKNWYPRPIPPDFQFEERNVSNQFSISSSKLYEWNIDSLSEQEILNKIQHMTIVANNYLNESRPHLEVIELITLGFKGKLLQWWNNCLT